MDDRCDRYQICRYRFAGMCLYPSNNGLKPCAKLHVGICETNETLIQEAKHES